MNRSTLFAILMLVSSPFLFSGCVVLADDYYSDPYYPPDVVVVPALPYSVDLYAQSYYSYSGYYYFYNNQCWYYSRTRGGNWIKLPRTHWPYDTRWKGHHFRNDHRDHKYDRHGEPRSKDPRHKDKQRGEMDHRGEHPGKRAMDRPEHDRNKMKQEQDNRNQRKVPSPQNKKGIEKQNNTKQLQKNQIQKDRRTDQMDQRGQYPGKRAMDPGQHDNNKMKQNRNDRNQREVYPTRDKRLQDGKKRTEEEVIPR